MRQLVIISAILLSLFIAVGEFRDYLNLYQKGKSAQNPNLASANITLPDRVVTSSTIVAEEIKAKSPLQVAQEYLERHREAWKLQPYHEFRAVEFKTPIGSKVKYSVYQGEIPIIDMGIEIQIGNDLSVVQVKNDYRPVLKVEVGDELLTAKDILVKTHTRYEAEDESHNSPPVLFVRPGSKTPEVAYVIPVKDKAQEQKGLQLLVRATDGQILQKSYSRSEF